MFLENDSQWIILFLCSCEILYIYKIHQCNNKRLVRIYSNFEIRKYLVSLIVGENDSFCGIYICNAKKRKNIITSHCYKNVNTYMYILLEL